MREIIEITPESDFEMSKRLMFSAIIAIGMMVATTVYSHSLNQVSETAAAYELANS